MTRSGGHERTVWGLAAAMVLVVWLAGAASAAGWTIQIVALRDLRDAVATAEDLETFGLDAYTEFAMWEGEQFVRVRFGCFQTREDALALARHIDDRLVEDAVPVERTPGAPAHGCVEERTGFIKPAEWRQIAEGAPAFEVTMMGTTAVIRHTGRRWRINQQEEEPLPSFVASASRRFRQGHLVDVPVVEALIGNRAWVVCPGRLLAEAGDVAIVDRGDTIVSCQLHPPDSLVEAD